MYPGTTHKIILFPPLLSKATCSVYPIVPLFDSALNSGKKNRSKAKQNLFGVINEYALPGTTKSKPVKNSRAPFYEQCFPKTGVFRFMPQ